MLATRDINQNRDVPGRKWTSSAKGMEVTDKNLIKVERTVSEGALQRNKMYQHSSSVSFKALSSPRMESALQGSEIPISTGYHSDPNLEISQKMSVNGSGDSAVDSKLSGTCASVPSKALTATPMRGLPPSYPTSASALTQPSREVASPLSSGISSFITGDLLLSSDEFVEELVREVRQSCQSDILFTSITPEPSNAHASSTSPFPVESAATLMATEMGVVEEKMSSRLLSENEIQRFDYGSPLHAFASDFGGSSSAAESSVTSPEPKVPTIGLYEAGGAIHSSLQHSRCAGVSRDRSTSEETERLAMSEPLPATAEVVEVEVAMTRRHPVWRPLRPVSERRPGWNQRRPTRKEPPVVSAPGTTPPPLSSDRRRSSVPRSPCIPEEHQGGAQMTNRRRSISPSFSQLHRANSEESKRCHGTASIAAPPTPRPSARALFHEKEECDGAVPATTTPTTTRGVEESEAKAGGPLSPELEKMAMFYQRQLHEAQVTCDAALTRAARAEHHCGLLAQAVNQLLTEHRKERESWSARHHQLEGQLHRIGEWVRSVDGDADVLTQTELPSGEREVVVRVADNKAITPKLARGVVFAETQCRPADDTSFVQTSERTPGATLSVPGTTPTPSHRISSADRSSSSGGVRIPPSPPIHLQLHSSKDRNV